MIIDNHVHIFPYLGSACGWESAEAHLDFLGKFMYGAAHPDVAENPDFWTSELDIDFRVGKFGRFEWTEDGVDYYRQLMPPSLQDQTSSPEFIIAQMDHTGVDMAVLQNAQFYGKLNDYFAESVRKYPDRFVGLAEINELEADKESEILKLRHAIKNLGLKGIYYDAKRFHNVGNLGGFKDKKFDIFWQEVSDLGIPAHWSFTASRMSEKTCMEQTRLFSAWAERFPDIPSVVTEGLVARLFKENDNDEVRFPREYLDIFKKPNVFVEIACAIQVGPLGWDYPFPEAQRLIREQYEELGPHKLIWGSDMPNVERNCTYKQSLTHLKDYCDFINPHDMDLILGGNITRILKIQTDVPRTPGPKLAGTP